MAANFRMFLNVAIFLEEGKTSTAVKTEMFRFLILLQDEDHSASRPHSFPSFLRLCFGMFPERFRSASVSVGSGEVRLI